MSKQQHAARLFDMIREHGLVGRGMFAGRAQEISALIRAAQPIAIDNVDQYWGEHMVTECVGRPLEEVFACVAPPFGETFFEYNSAPERGGITGVLVSAHEIDAALSSVSHELRPDEILSARAKMIGGKWLLSLAFLYGGRGLRTCILDGCVTVIVGPDGSIASANAHVGDDNGGENGVRIQEFMAMTSRALLALVLMNCKNVEISVTSPPVALNKARERRGKPPLIAYHTLDIRPMQVILRNEGQIETNGLKKALHICRGHFKDYRQGKGLFGRTKGLFWVDAHQRGNEDLGRVEKEYRVHPPEET
jgi:hypothetical protein